MKCLKGHPPISTVEQLLDLKDPVMPYCLLRSGSVPGAHERVQGGCLLLCMQINNQDNEQDNLVNSTFIVHFSYNDISFQTTPTLMHCTVSVSYFMYCIFFF